MSNLPPQSPRLQSAIKNFKAGTRLILENDTSSRKMFIIRKGKARVYKTYHGQRITLAILGEGEVFGEMGFFDAEPRSASVEALTDLTAVVLDGEDTRKELSGLPEWIYPIFKTVFHRFREMDRKVVILQSMNEYQKRAFRMDNVAKTIHLDVVRFIKTLRIIYERDLAASGEVKSEKLYSELDHVLGTRSVGLRAFWRMLKEYDFLDHGKDDAEGVVVLNEVALGKWEKYLASQVENEKYLLLSHSAIAVLGKIVGFIHAVDHQEGAASEVTVKFGDIYLDRMPLHEEALKELDSKGILKVIDDTFRVRPGDIYYLYTYQSILKAFDHTVIHAE